MNQTFEETFHQLSWDWSESFHSDYTQTQSLQANKL